MTLAPEAAGTVRSQSKEEHFAEHKFVPVKNQPRVVIKSADMPEDMIRKAIELALTALDRFELERDMAKFLKKEFDTRYQPSWHCIVGRHFGSYVTHESSGFLYFYIEKTAVLLFRSG
ncbi:Dynein light chain LC6, flagellar outer arm [Gracilariopsis chorda]|uniref:Dynein light chain n=1 Tax=Gracilariopsis chorda TaxID=448386 RepID=A0A2V3J408_9FLOR|nr:Dynein light chain LC6, flagellar outer arm [Gracilariopsis chorda]|eukprot:PXF49125.1 Dynein light chain LC6, flagellar outer arm [Gracilariopsis chorda]